MTHRPRGKSLLTKRSIYIWSRKSSVHVERAFWDALWEIAEAQGLTLTELIARIDKGRNTPNLSSAIRLFVLDHYRRRSKRPGMIMHKFYLGQAVTYYPPHGAYVPSGTWIVTAKLPERNGECYYRVRHASERHERVVREGELSAIADNDEAPAGQATR